MKALAIALLTSLSVTLCPLRAATLPSGFSEFLVASGLSSPTAMEFAPDGRLFVCEQDGRLRVIKNLSLLPAPFLTVATDSSGERGLLGIAFDPGFSMNNYVYVYYTATSPAIHNRISRFTANGDVAVAGSEVVILDLENVSAANHNGGAIHFGSDGRLFVAVGENAVPGYSQDLFNRLGKILRINPDGSIPPDNPFFHTASGANRAIWALGLRNPYTFAIQPGSGRMFINDVGEVTAEEINEGVPGANYGWPHCEGRCDAAHHDPIFQYGRAGAVTGCAITGGAFYNPVAPQFPREYEGNYFFADLCGGWIRRLDPSTGATWDFASGIPSPVDLKVSAEGRLFYLARNGHVWAVDFSTAAPVLGIGRQGANLVIVWPAPSSGYVLQSTAALGTGHRWSTVSTPPQVVNGRHEVMVSPSRATRFYRLARE